MPSFPPADPHFNAHGAARGAELRRRFRSGAPAAHTSGLAGFDDDALSLPVAGGPGNPFGTIFNVYGRPDPKRQKMYGVAGHSFVSLVEFSKIPKAKSILVFGADVLGHAACKRPFLIYQKT